MNLFYINRHFRPSPAPYPPGFDTRVCELESKKKKKKKIMEGEDKVDFEWCVSLPKIELHAHLNGSIRDSTLLELAEVLGKNGVIDFADMEHIIKKNARSLVDCFKLFDLIHIVATDHATVTKITREVIEDFAAENVVYLELRTTPKKNESIGMSKRSYMEAVIEGLKTVDSVDVSFTPFVSKPHPSNQLSLIPCNNGRKKIFVRLLLSIDRRETAEAAFETVQLAVEMKGMGVIGIDLSGNPKVGQWSTFLPALNFAKEEALPITLHCGEVPNPKEVQSMLDFHPQRIGHACCFDEEAWSCLKTSNIPVEVCVTSNITTNTIPLIEKHHFADLYRAKHPLVICTDDTGVFSTSLSREYHIIASAFGLNKQELSMLAKNAVEFIFAQDVKQMLTKVFVDELGELC